MLQQTLHDWKQQAKVRYQQSPLPQFFAWWWSELSPLIPDGFLARLMPPAPSVWLVPDASTGDVVVWAMQEDLRQIDVFNASEDAKLLQSRWKGILASFDQGLPKVIVCLPTDAVLERVIELPMAVESNLRQSIQYQLDQLTPFDPSAVYFDHHILRRDPTTGRLTVSLSVLPIQGVVDWMDRLEAIGIKAHVIDRLQASSADNLPARSGFNLLPETKRPAYVYARAQMNWRLAGVAALVLVCLMAGSVYLRDRSITRLGLQVEALRSEAQAVMSLQRELGDALDAANFLAQKRAEAPVMVHVLNEVTRLLPERMWLQQMQIRGNELTMMGYAEGSQQLIELINDAPLLKDAAFRGRVTIDPETNQERFTVQAVIDRGDGRAVAAAEGE